MGSVTHLSITVTIELRLISSRIIYVVTKIFHDHQNQKDSVWGVWMEGKMLKVVLVIWFLTSQKPDVWQGIRSSEITFPT